MNEKRGNSGALSRNALRHLETAMLVQGSNAKVAQFLSHLSEADLENQSPDGDFSSARKPSRMEGDGASLVPYEASSTPNDIARLTKDLGEDRSSQHNRESADLDTLASKSGKLRSQGEESDTRRNSGSQERLSDIELNVRSERQKTLDIISDSQDPHVPREDSQRPPLQAVETPPELENVVKCTYCGEVSTSLLYTSQSYN